MQVYMFINLSARAGGDTRSIFKLIFIDLNSDFSFPWTCCRTKVKEPILPYYLHITKGE